MLLLLGVAFVAGVVTAFSPCVLPVLPVVLAGGTGGGKRRPYAVVAGLVASFTLFTLAAASLLSALGLPDDLLRNGAIALVALVGVSLAWPRLGRLLERPLAPLGRRAPGDLGGGFLLGVGLGLVYTPCAGPVIAAVAALAATQALSLAAVAVTAAYALGSGVVLLAFALFGRRGLGLPRLRRAAPLIRRGLGAAVVAVAVLMALGVDSTLRTRVPEYTRALQGLETSASAGRRIEALLVSRSGTRAGSARAAGGELDDFGPAPEFKGIASWLNSGPLTIAGLRGRVVLLDFWTYSCINCLRTLPYLERWYETYRDEGLVLVGVHSPEFAFERDASNVASAVRRLGVRYPVALDPDFATWQAWGNQYWPATYFVDRAGHVRHAHFGEGDYAESEHVIRELLAEQHLPAPVAQAVVAPRAADDVETPETYLGYERLASLAGSRVRPNREAEYGFPASLAENGVAYAGRWTVEAERIVAGEGARLRLSFRAREVNLVLGMDGESGAVDVLVDGRFVRRVRVSRDDVYSLASFPGPARRRLLELRVSRGTAAYAFTFG